MKSNQYIFLLLLSVVIVSCQGSNGITEKVSTYYKERGITFDIDTECCVILPEVGCEGCIAAGVRCFLDNKNSFFQTPYSNDVMEPLYKELAK